MFEMCIQATKIIPQLSDLNAYWRWFVSDPIQEG